MTNTFKPGDVVTFAWYDDEVYTVAIHEGSDEAGYSIFYPFNKQVGGHVGRDLVPVAELKRITND